MRQYKIRKDCKNWWKRQIISVTKTHEQGNTYTTEKGAEAKGTTRKNHFTYGVQGDLLRDQSFGFATKIKGLSKLAISIGDVKQKM